MSSMTHIPQSNYQPIIDALADYADRTGIDLSTNPFADKLQDSSSPDAILELLYDREKAFKEYRNGSWRLIRPLSPAVRVLHAFSGVLGESVSLVSIAALDPLHRFHTTSLGAFLTIEGHLRWYQCSSRRPCPLLVFDQIHLTSNLGCQ